MTLIAYGWWHTHIEPRDDEGAKIYFERALKADPFNVTVLEEVMYYYRVRYRNHPRMPELAERLEQIVPETAEERNQTKMSVSVRLRELFVSYQDTGDSAFRAEWLRLAREATRDSQLDFAYLHMQAFMFIQLGDFEGLIEFVEQNYPADFSYEALSRRFNPFRG